jgi:hypothetical protein
MGYYQLVLSLLAFPVSGFKGISEVLKLEWLTDCAFLRVNQQVEFAFDETGDSPFYPVGFCCGVCSVLRCFRESIQLSVSARFLNYYDLG